MKNDLISIIVPVYKVEKYLNKCIESIVNQTYKNLEIILVDDGSPDNCPKMCEDWAKKDKRIKVIHQKNGGLSAARNTGIEKSTGNFLAFIDSDDYVNVHFIETLYSNLIKTNSDLSIIGFKKVFEDTEINIQENPNKNLQVFDNSNKFEQLYNKSHRLMFVVAWNKLYKREIFINTNLRYPLNKIHEDEAVAVDIINASKKICYEPVEYYYYLQRKDSIMGKTKSEKSLSVFEFYNNRVHFFKKNYVPLYKHSLEILFNSMIREYFFSGHLRKQILDIYKKYYNEHKDSIKILSAKQKLKIFTFNNFRLMLKPLYMIKKKVELKNIKNKENLK